MFPELSLHILDIAENSVRAGADRIDIEVAADSEEDILSISIRDNGCGMTREQIAQVEDPFFTTRTTRRVGLGIPFFKQAAEMSGGRFSITSAEKEGTLVKAVFGLSHVDRMPVGDLPATMHTLITMHEDRDFCFVYRVDARGFELDTRNMREILGDVSFREAEISAYIKEYLQENTKEVTGDRVL